MWGWSLGEAWADFLSGKAIATFSWGDVGSLTRLLAAIIPPAVLALLAQRYVVRALTAV
jgi:ABC-type glycerol-3-phosphate transport system permease component